MTAVMAQLDSVTVSLGHEIFARRALHRWRQDQLGQIVGVDQRTISRWENAESSIRFVEFVKVAMALGIAPEDLLNRALARTLRTPLDELDKVLERKSAQALKEGLTVQRSTRRTR